MELRSHVEEVRRNKKNEEWDEVITTMTITTVSASSAFRATRHLLSQVIRYRGSRDFNLHKQIIHEFTVP